MEAKKTLIIHYLSGGSSIILSAPKEKNVPKSDDQVPELAVVCTWVVVVAGRARIHHASSYFLFSLNSTSCLAAMKGRGEEKAFVRFLVLVVKGGYFGILEIGYGLWVRGEKEEENEQGSFCSSSQHG